MPCRWWRRLVGAAPVMLCVGSVLGNPLGPKVVGGGASVAGQNTATVTVTQSTDRAIVDWKSFNIGVGEVTTFNQPSASSVILNRVTGPVNPSVIEGTLTANGRVFLVNPDGILFGKNAVVNTGSFLATTSDIKNDNFMAGHYTFGIAGRPDASIVNRGTITAQASGFAALVAPGVRNSGTITATLGTVTLAAANSFTLDFYGDRLITLAVGDQIASTVRDVATGKPLSVLVKNTGKLSANGGRVELTAAAARQVVNSVINNKGIIEANSIGTRNGMIVLSAATGASKPAGTPKQVVKVSGTLSASGKKPGEKGGKVQITGESIKVAGANIDSSGVVGGGTVVIGGDWSGGHPQSGLVTNASASLEAGLVPTASTVTVDAGTTINVSALQNGNGGKAVVWSDMSTTFAGSIFARGGALSGDGGFVEVSGHDRLNFSGSVDLRAPSGGKGTLLLDPRDVTIGDTGSFVITVAALQTALATGNVIVTTSSPGSDAGDITVSQSVGWANGSTLTLSANRNIVINDGVTIANSGTGSLNLRADSVGTGLGTVNFLGTGKVDFSQSSGAVSIFYNPSGGYANPVNYASNVLTNANIPNQLAAYMLVNSAVDLQSISLNTFGTYALGKDIDASATASWNAGAGFIPIPFLSGILDGQGHTINGLTINASPSGVNQVGLFEVNSAGSTVRNLGLTNVNINAIAPANGVGAVAGTNLGTIANSYVTGSVTAGPSAVVIDFPSLSSSFAAVGGVVGTNTGTIVQSHSTASVTGRIFDVVGNLVGDNIHGMIEQSFATGIVSGGGGLTIISYPDKRVTIYSLGTGGLVGVTLVGSIDQSYSTGAVNVGRTVNLLWNYAGGPPTQTSPPNVSFKFNPSPYIGGLIGNASDTSVTNSYWDAQASGRQFSAGGTGLTTPQLQAALPSGFNNAVWAITPGASYPFLVNQSAAAQTLFAGPVPQAPIAAPPGQGVRQNGPVLPNPQTQIISEFTNWWAGSGTIIDLTLAQTDSGTGTNGTRGPPTGPTHPSGIGEANFTGVPPPGETRFVSDEVVIQFGADVSLDQLEEIARRFGLSIITSENLAIVGRTLVRLRITNGQSVRDIIRAIEAAKLTVIATPNYQFVLAQGAADPAASNTTSTDADPGQYVVDKLHLTEAHRLSKGDKVLIAVIDSGIDADHPDLQGAIAERFDEAGTDTHADAHGTGMAGAIASHRRLLGVAPNAKLLTVRAFAPGTTEGILQGLDWAIGKGARIVNMSFAGPLDPMLQEAIKRVRARNVLLVAAAGNAGPKSPPLYPGADPNVLAVTATDADDNLFEHANQGRYISLAAPGVDVLVPALDAGYQLTTGTSVAAAHVSGVAALLMARNPKADAENIRAVLLSTARDLGPKGRDDQFGWGLVDPLKALRALDAQASPTH